MVIPKIIHYCMFGDKKVPKHIKKCMDSWGKLNGYKFIEWDEKNFDVNYSEFTRECYQAKKYAYVSDICRLEALYNYGGIYLDTDVLINKNFDELLENQFFLGFLYDSFLGTAVIGSSPKHPVIKELLEEYQNLTFESAPDTNNEIFTKFFLKKYNLQLNNEEQVLEHGVHIYPKESFEMPSFKKKKNYAIHISFGSWKPTNNTWKSKAKRRLMNLPGGIYVIAIKKRIIARKGNEYRKEYFNKYLESLERANSM